MTEEKNSANTVDLAKEWLLNSGIQNVGKDAKINGGFNSWFDFKNKNYPYIYSEITGYGISSLLFINKAQPDKILMERAKLAADWLMKFAIHESGGVRTRYYYEKNSYPKEYSFDNGLMFVFDSGMVMYGFVMLYKETKDEKYLKAAEKIAEFLMKCYKGNGLFYAAYDSQKDNFIDDVKKWSYQSGSFHCKVALGLLELSEINDEDSYKKAAIDLCKTTVEMQEEDGKFETFRGIGDTNLHPHLYSTEGLTYVGIKLNNENFLRSAARACEWVLKSQMKNGGIPCMFVKGKFVQEERSDVLAQTLRIASILAEMNILDVEDLNKKLKKLKARLITFQNLHEDQKGGFFYGSDETGKRLDHLNSWCTMFAVQAVNMHEHLEKKMKIEIEPFI